MPTLEYVYRVRAVEKVTDGDTYWLHLDVGFRQLQLTHLRLLGWDTPERNRGSDFEKSEAVRASYIALVFLISSQPLWCQTEKDPDSFGRWLATIWHEDETGIRTFLHDALAAEELATPWPTRWRDVFDPGATA